MKLRLNLDQLSVDSFATDAAAAPGGTVFGEQCTCPNATCANTCPATCALTCDDMSCHVTCGYTCGDSCGCPTAYDYTCEGCTYVDATCRGYGTCGIYPCRDVP
jgi:hypothetical protein